MCNLSGKRLNEKCSANTLKTLSFLSTALDIVDAQFLFELVILLRTQLFFSLKIVMQILELDKTLIIYVFLKLINMHV